MVTHFHLRKFLALFWFACPVADALATDPTWNYAVEVSATVPASPPWNITLTWPQDTTPSGDYSPTHTVFRKAADGTWGTGVTLAPGETSYVDHEVEEGTAYEYRVAREFRRPNFPTLDHDAYGYIQAGINVPTVHERGKAIVVVEHGIADGIPGHVERLRQDLIGDGWTVALHRVAADAAPSEVRTVIRDEYLASKEKAHALLLIGRVPIVRSGSFAPDFHEHRAMPADVFYGDIDGKWTDAEGEGILDEDVLPSDVELQVGRIYFGDLERIGTGKTELELTARYLDKNHAFRHATVRPPRRALMSDRVGVDRGRAPAASGYRAFATFFGPENVFTAGTNDDARDEDRWISKLTANPYLWSFASGGGGDSAIAFNGTQGEYKSASSSDVAAGAKGTFYLFFGSYFVDWSKPDNLLRSALAAPTYGLAAAWAGRPSLYFHHMGLGDTIGHGIRLSQNNDGFYYSPGFPTSWRRHVHVALLGDPTLRLDYVAPAAGLTATRGAGGVTLNWKPSADAETAALSYHVYRSSSWGERFGRLTTSSISDTTFVDPAAPERVVYMVRAVKVQKTNSGTYLNASQGVFAESTQE